MSKPLGISELVARVGDENIQVQNLGDNMTAANNGKKMATITFATSPDHCQQMMRRASGIKSSVVGLVLWMPVACIAGLSPVGSTSHKAPDVESGRRGVGGETVFPGQRVKYRDEFGTVTSSNHRFWFVRFDSQVEKLGWSGATSQACSPSDLEVVEGQIIDGAVAWATFNIERETLRQLLMAGAVGSGASSADKGDNRDSASLVERRKAARAKEWNRWWLKHCSTSLDRAFLRGKKAYRAGKPISPNPYRNGCPQAAMEWEAGWRRTKIGDEFLKQQAMPNEKLCEREDKAS